ncbi:DHA2 family efflux MFS transporter permease subunit [Labedaea rhizosphaerae]|uniref:EmrB/QacA subfamily drug resistance transporter n=1 Tax=Labedaea rhizosphaerae TaxID=598644 RepID=A0A4R6SC34_LABRH|nr:DHA2 family efflux MFS transporter permease subunit [Labedaea rhizosphaerae]TDP96475.1 EmrB/QacA subfamily drug resistance transporter [Labedaea rhizosphaerae]
MTLAPSPPESVADPAEAPPQTPPPPGPLTVAVAVSGSFLAMLDTTIVNVSLHATSARFGDIGSVQWVLTSYLLALVATMPATAWLTSRFGPKRVFVTALTIFMLGSAACALSPTLASLVAGRAVAGGAAGVLLPAATVLLTYGQPLEQLGKVQALNGSVMMLAPLLGPAAGGLLVAGWGWPGVYAINVPLCLVILIVAAVKVARDRGGQTTPLDVRGLLAIVLGTTGLVMAIGSFSHGVSLTSKEFLVPLGVGVGGVVGFVIRELRAEHPLLDLRLFGIGVYRMAALNIAFLGFLLYAPMVLIPLYFEAARGESAVLTGLLVSVGGVGVVVAGRVCRWLMPKILCARTMLIGIGLTIAATVPMLMLTASTSYYLVCAALVVRGIGTGLTIVPAMTAAFMSIKAAQIPDAAAQLNLVQRIGGTFAAAVMMVVLGYQATVHKGLSAPAFADSFGVLLATSALTLFPALALLRAELRAKRAS